ncbi:MAG: hypothetical protein JNM62_15330 [Flavobacteriales bacterium]|nr:hypothetical protein [Flavobacteriales bacterium]
MRLVLATLFLPLQLLGQQPTLPHDPYKAVPSEVVIGLGIGQPFGGIGAQLAARPADQLDLFAGGGFVMSGMGYNLGLRVRLMPASPACPFLTAMYGYNAVIHSNVPHYNTIYYGPTFGGGIEFHGRRRPERFFSLHLLFPLRPQAYDDDIEAAKRNPLITEIQETWDVTIALGWHFGN